MEMDLLVSELLMFCAKKIFFEEIKTGRENSLPVFIFLIVFEDCFLVVVLKTKRGGSVWLTVR